ncbi:hypothetical protein D5R81_14635 [Parashewanella spongiae]|uniref:Uncharacterized protein n=1 Tax=Parashewanella spongiae TaxID=342950 RepID=A0A3A6TRP2_9GAMM|nr:hypothetical protein [Parashewanella spongiae]MCL1079315.1 hypothetical protein [Parashewanella spongiae]RJY10522.1 hypothetical protein D5R81_14635 [Parashewanella spongiae]
MNRHTKVAILIAPILAIAGYILSDTYIENQAQEQRVFALNSESECDVLAKRCVLSAGELKINVYDEHGITFINSTFPLDKATLFLVDQHDQATSYPLAMEKSAYYWSRQTPLRNNLNDKNYKQKIRLIAQIKGGQYIGEFNTNSL